MLGVEGADQASETRPGAAGWADGCQQCHGGWLGGQRRAEVQRSWPSSDLHSSLRSMLAQALTSLLDSFLLRC